MKKHLVLTIIFILYSALLINVMVFKNIPVIRIGHLMFNFGGREQIAGNANFIPFRIILSYLRGDKGAVIGLFEIVGNIALLVPIGLLVPFVFRNVTTKKVLIIAVASGLIIEILQVIFHIGIFDIDDVILNGLGVMIGYGIINAKI